MLAPFVVCSRAALVGSQPAGTGNGQTDDVDSQCPTEASSGGPLFGIASSQIEEDVFAENDAHPDTIDVPLSRFRGHKAFTITRTAGPDSGCSPRYGNACSESGTLTLTLRFTPR